MMYTHILQQNPAMSIGVTQGLRNIHAIIGGENVKEEKFTLRNYFLILWDYSSSDS